MSNHEIPFRAGTSLATRLATTEDEGFLFRLFVEARAEEFQPLGWDETRLNTFLRMQFEARSRDYATRFTGAEQRIILLDGSPAGLLWLHRSPKEIRLLDLTISETRRSGGIGTALLRSLQADSRRAALPLRHMVAKTNTRAFSLYERMGFASAMDAGSHILMEWLPTD